MVGAVADTQHSQTQRTSGAVPEGAGAAVDRAAFFLALWGTTNSWLLLVARISRRGPFLGLCTQQTQQQQTSDPAPLARGRCRRSSSPPHREEAAEGRRHLLRTAEPPLAKS